MSALMSCGVFAAIGTAVGARSKALGICWREPCRTPDFRTIRGLVTDIGTVLVLRNRHEFAATRDWAKGARFHELFLTIDELARAGIEPGLTATLEDTGENARQKLARKERYDRAVALIPVFAVSLLAALLVVPPLAGDEPLPSLWEIVTGTAGAARPSSTTSSNESDGTPSPAAERSAGRKSEGEANQVSRDPGSSGRSASARVEAPASGDEPAAAGAAGNPVEGRGQKDAASGAGERTSSGDGAGSALARAARRGAGDTPGSGAGANGQVAVGSGQGPGAASESGSPKGEQSGGAGGRGGSPKGYGKSGVAPQRAESPAAVPEQPPNPGKVIEVVLPPLTQSKDGSAGDDPTGQKRNGTAPTDTLAYRPVRDGSPLSGDPATREPVQRWPNWVYRLLHK
jgi:hypothetical protein